jgi:putative transposase
MHYWSSVSYVKWDCKYHIEFVPKYRQKKLHGQFHAQVEEILRDLCRQRGLELIKGHLMPDHIHMCLSVPPKYSIKLGKPGDGRTGCWNWWNWGN